MTSRPVTGVGVGLRIELANALFDAGDGLVDFVEVHPENHRDRGGVQAAMLDRARSRYPILTHGLTMGFASTDRVPDLEYAALKRFLDQVGTPFHSDHFCFARADGTIPHELLPPRFDEATIALAVESIERMRDAIGRPVAIENVSYYVPRSRDPLAEVDALAEILARSGAGLLLDVNNVVVNAHNHGFDPHAYLARIPYDRVAQIHVAGHAIRPDGLRIDTHGSTSDDETRALLAEVLRHTGPVPVLLERDNDVPVFSELAAELRELRAIYDVALAIPEERSTVLELFSRSRRTDADPLEGEPANPHEMGRAVVRGAFAEGPIALGTGIVADRWSLYRTMVRGRLHDLVRAALPRTRDAIGAPALAATFDRFLAESGPTTPIFWRVVVEFGRDLLGTLDGYEADLARLDLAIWRARQAPYPEAASGLAEFDFERPIVLNPARETFDAAFPVDAADPESARTPGARRIVVVRGEDDSPTILGLNAAAAAFLDHVERDGASARQAALGIVADRSLVIDEGFLDGLATMLAQWIEVGFVLGVLPSPDATSASIDARESA